MVESVGSYNHGRNATSDETWRQRQGEIPWILPILPPLVFCVSIDQPYSEYSQQESLRNLVAEL